VTGGFDLMTRETHYGITTKYQKHEFLTIRDPFSKQPLIKLKNPKVPIVNKNGSSKRKFVDLKECVRNNEKPNFGMLCQPMMYDEEVSNWEILTKLIN